MIGKVYIAIKGADYDGSWIIGVFLDKDAAIAHVKAVAKSEGGEFTEHEHPSAPLWIESDYYYFQVQEWEVL